MSDDVEGLTLSYVPIQLLDAPGWNAVFEDEEAARGHVVTALAMWALCEVRVEDEDEDTTFTIDSQVTGMVLTDEGIRAVEEADNFLGYLQPGDSLAEFLARKGLDDAPSSPTN